MAQAAKKVSYALALVSTDEKNKALRLMADALRAHQDYLIKENKKDIKAAEAAKLSKALIDRLILNEKRIAAMEDSLEETIKLKDPIGEILETAKRLYRPIRGEKSALVLPNPIFVRQNRRL